MRVIELFKQLTKLNRCSKKYNSFLTFAKTFAKTNNYQYIIDDANNILIKKENSKATICLQAHMILFV